MSNIEVGTKVLVRHPYTDKLVEGQVIAKELPQSSDKVIIK